MGWKAGRHVAMRRGRLNTAKRLSWVKKNYPSEVYVRTAIIALDPNAGPGMDFSYPDRRHLVDVGLKDWGQYDLSELQYSRAAVFDRTKQQREDRKKQLRKGASEQSYEEIHTGNIQDLVRRFIRERAPEGAAGHPIDPLIPWIAQNINRHRKELRRLRKGWEGKTTRQSDGILIERKLHRLSSLYRSLQHIMDWVAAERPNLSQITMGDAISKADLWHEENAERMRLRAKGQSVAKAGAVIRRWKDGWTMREIGTRPDDLQVNVQELRAIGEQLQHCYGDAGTARVYADDMRGVRKRMYVLFDPKGAPHVAIDLRVAREDQRRPDVHEKWKKRPKLPVASDVPIYANDIIQVRGKNNSVPQNEKYRAKTLEFLSKIMDWDPKHLPWYSDELDEAGYLLPREELAEWFIRQPRKFEDLDQLASDNEIQNMLGDEWGHYARSLPDYIDWVSKVDDIDYAADYGSTGPQYRVEGDVQLVLENKGDFVHAAVAAKKNLGRPKRRRDKRSDGKILGVQLALVYDLAGYLDDAEEGDAQAHWGNHYSAEEMSEMLGDDDPELPYTLHQKAQEVAQKKAIERTFHATATHHPVPGESLFLVGLGNKPEAILSVPFRHDPLQHILSHLKWAEEEYPKVASEEYFAAIQREADKRGSSNRVARRRRSRHNRGATRSRKTRQWR